MKNSYFVTGIGTGIGKTVISAILTEKLEADYWKPIQSGDLHASDSMSVADLISNTKTRVHPEVYRLNHPLSPHQSAAIDGIHIQLDKFSIPETDNNLIIEGAGGLMVPLNDKHLLLDLIRSLETQVIVVVSHYLGSINHTLLTCAVLEKYKVPVAGLIFNGAPNEESRRYILNYTGLNNLGEVPELSLLNKESIVGAGSMIHL